MPQSAHRHKPHHKHQVHQNHTHDLPRRTKRSAAILMSFFIGIVGMAIAAFAGGLNFWMVAGAAAGAFAGYLIGHDIDKTAANKSK
jgi:uncharacterized membrane protein YfcA